MLSRIVYQDAVGAQHLMVKLPGLLVEGQQDVHLITEGRHRPHTHPELKHDRPALDLGWIGAKCMHMVAAAGVGPGQNVAG